MKKVWQVELDLLEQLINVCKEHNLRMWVDYGTLLGAVRHKGFIPWDDDIDVCMPREDYDRLLEIGGKAFSEPYFLQSAYSDKDYYRGHAQLRNSNTTGIRPSDSYQPFNQGIFIDIFVMDGVPEDHAESVELSRWVRKKLRYLKSKNCAILASGRLGLVFRKMKCRREVSRRGWSTMFREIEDKLREHPFDKSRQVAEISFCGLDFVLERNIFDETIWLDFEDLKVPAPKAYDRLLRVLFGDNYMTPIMTGTSHGEVIFDPEKSYKETLPQVRAAYRRSALRRLWAKVKE
ncbi:MAG: LicD family protein [Bacteroidaceae bacterium]|nr:LicD family protein [Bacteroidaceae bacterium]